jgi:hypothetical protein
LALGCLTTAAITRQGQYELGEVYALTVNRGQPVLIQRASAPGRVELLISQQYRIVEAEGQRGPYKVETRGYMYAVATHAGQEIVAYHWHPGGPSLVRRPHLQFEAGAQVTNGEIAAAHFPTGRVSVEQFLRFAIETFRRSGIPGSASRTG